MFRVLASGPATFRSNAGRYGIRPEHFSLADDGLPVDVVVVEPTGSETQVVATLGGETISCVFRDRIDARPGGTIRVTPDMERIHLFDTDTGDRLVDG